MKLRILVIAIVTSTSFGLFSCRETVREETIVREVEVESDPIEERVEEEEGVLERTAEEIDEEVNEEINEEIEKIGDDA